MAVKVSMFKGNCSNCGRKIQKTTTNKCMYCGTDLEPHQRFTQEEKRQILESKKELEKQLETKDGVGHAKGIGTAFLGGGEFGGGGGDC